MLQHRLIAALGITFLVVGSAARSEDRRTIVDEVVNEHLRVQAAAGAPASDTLQGNESSQGVYVRDSAIAAEKLALAQKMERLKEWTKAADLLQEVVEKFPDRVVQSKVDSEHNVTQYKSVSVSVQQRLSKWPDEGLRVYKARFEPAAAALLQQGSGGDYAALHKCFAQYFVSESGKAAGLRLIERYLENGEFAAAAWLGDSLLQWHPGLLVERPAVLYRTAIAYHLSNDDGRARQRLDELKSGHAKAKGMVGGVDVILADSLAMEMETAPPKSSAVSADCWPTFMGDVSRGRISTGMGRTGAKAFVSIDLARRAAARIRTSSGAVAIEPPRESSDGSTLGIIPVVDGNELFFQDGQKIYAVSLESGLPLAGWLASYSGDRNGRYAAPVSLPVRGGQTTLTISDDCVLAIMGAPIIRTAEMINRLGELALIEPQTRLVCLERSTGKERWVVTPKQLPNEGTLRNLSFSGSPLLVGDNVYIIGRGGKSNQLEDCYVLCFDRRGGNYRWSCYVASANTGNMMAFGGEMPPPVDTVSHLAYSSGRLFVLSNLGAVAAIDAYGGTVVWLNLYPRDVEMGANMFPGGFAGRRNPSPFSKPWSSDAAIVQNGKLFVLPTDGKHVLVYDAGSGEELQRINLLDFGNPDTLLGVAGERLVLAGEQMVYCINWTKYWAWKSNVARDPSIVFWSVPTNKTPIRGRGFVTADSVFISTREHIHRCDLLSGRVLEMYPPSPRTWDDDEGPGNILVTSDKVIIAGARRINVYTDLGAAIARIEQDIKAAPADADPRLRYAEIMFTKGDSGAAAAKLDEAINLLGGPGAMRPGAARDRVFATALAFASKLADPRNASSEPASIAQFFDRAAGAASSASQQVSYRLARARFAHSTRDFAAEVRLYQELLGDDELRAVSVSDDDGNPIPAGGLAESRIAAIIKSDGSRWYTRYEQAAREAMGFARARADASELLAIAQRYPNSSVAPAAMSAAADAFEAAGNPRRATQLLRQISSKYPEFADKAKVLEAMARNYLAMPGRLDLAIARLSQAARLPGELRLQGALKLPDGQVLIEKVTYSVAVEQLRRFKMKLAAGAVPQLGLPIPRGSAAERAHIVAFKPETAASVITGIEALVRPQVGFSRHDRVAGWSRGTGVSVFAVGQTTPLLTCAVADPPKALAWLGNTLLLWTEQEIILIGEKGQPLWKSALRSLPDAELLAPSADVPTDAEAQGGVDGQIMLNGGAVVLRGGQRIVINGGMLRLNAARLQMLGAAQQQLQPPPPVPAPGAAEQVAQVRPAGDRIVVACSNGRLFAIDAAEGRLAWQVRLASDRPVDRLLANDDFTVACFGDNTSSQIVVLDTYSGQFIRRYVFGPAQQGPVNVALSADGVLVYTLTGRICGKNLYESGGELSWESPESAPFVGAVREDQLIIADGRVLAISDAGNFVRIYSLETGRALRWRSADGRQETNAPLGTGSKFGLNVGMRVAGPWLYIFGTRSLMAYNLQQKFAGGSGGASANGVRWLNQDSTIREAIIGSSYVVLLDQIGALAGLNVRRGTTYRLLAYRRALEGEEVESGILDHMPVITDPAGIDPGNWQAVDGGFYYLSGDQKLHFLRGAS